MAQRWRVLILLFLVRTTLAFQFQAVGALSPAFQEHFGVGIADIGLLIGLYFAPGIVLAVPGGALGRRFGAKRMVVVGLGLMTAGGVLMLLSDSWAGQIAGRMIAGFGGVLLNVLMTKMVTDWFAGKEITFSLAAFVMSWPVGIASALVVLPLVGSGYGLKAALTLIAILLAMGLLAIALLYRAPPGGESVGAAAAAGGRMRGPLLGAIVAAGCIWGIYNSALSTIFSFGPTLFIARGMSPEIAGSTASIIMWMLAVVGPIAGFLVDRTGRRYLILAAGNLSFAAFVLIGSWTGQVLPIVIAMGLVSGVAVGSMMSLPAMVLPPAARALGMGIFFSIFHLFQALGPMLGGVVAELTGDIATTYVYAAILLVISVAILPVYHALAVKARRCQA